MKKRVAANRIRHLNRNGVRDEGNYVLYWMIAYRRTGWNFALDRALDWARELQKPLLVLEALRCDYPWASDRLHTFVLQGMADNAARFGGSCVGYYPYVEPERGAGRGLLSALAEGAAVVVSDDFPAFFLPRMLAAAADVVPVRLEAVDSNGLLPLRITDRVFTTAFSFRRFVQKRLLDHLPDAPDRRPLADLRLPPCPRLPAAVEQRWPPATAALEGGIEELVRTLPVDHAVGRAPFTGGEVAAQATLDRFVGERLDAYLEARNHPDADGSSNLSPYLHFGHIAAHEVFDAIVSSEQWSGRTGKPTGGREGWWNLSASAEGFLDQLVTWRELGFNMSWQRDDYDRYASLPEWARTTLEEHAGDARAHVYELAEFAESRTHDRLWNAAQTQLRETGLLHNYLRMLWGKKILEWTRSPEDALAVMVELNNRYAVDGRNPNSYSGIFWTLGRYDRAWGPERPIFGKVRYMSSDSTARKLRLRRYLEHYAPE